jgi:hypothetical protein
MVMVMGVFSYSPNVSRNKDDDGDGAEPGIAHNPSHMEWHSGCSEVLQSRHYHS